MIFAARVQAAIELLDLVIAAARQGGASADVIVSRYFATRRYAGSKDRTAVRDLVFAAIRRCGEMPESGRAAMLGLAEAQPDLRTAFTGEGHGPAALAPDEAVAEAALLPAWLMTRMAAAFGAEAEAEAQALLERAPFDLRVNRLKVSDADMVVLPVPAGPVAGLPLPLPFARRAVAAFNVEACAAWVAGEIEVQDAASQFAVALCAAMPGETVVDLCAGAGGKTLALAADMGGAGDGRLIACDSDRTRLRKLEPRAVRAGARGETRLLDPGREMAALEDLRGAADLVLVDAPCSGSGTWRRNPEARWRLTPERLARLCAEQARLLALGWELVRPGGRLVYAVCSVLEEEGPRVVADLGVPAVQHRLTPLGHGCDGFFVARMEKL
ncbi:RsmB/NOP family class I SAM-dependent RNA methyltransferase [Sandaracinobacteroides saxicola]|uniref:RsmB/NOP family class I SAM-dependent RNA methyltransferase n=1 Tax=Sandaracinobacteroides saxicola TaxID=2759707 RepID=A0A7G5IEW2_9SPHN|nr:RsmB/NOP family class I SAM-dependent RNA methyltransferase [Sandaracinobacteroides saxicola]QMW21904.1 RsmB/NOP family class I SAM-dependent RNA methyltransferase [Sandaracinobacteroides saxicola]